MKSNRQFRVSVVESSLSSKCGALALASTMFMLSACAVDNPSAETADQDDAAIGVTRAPLTTSIALLDEVTIYEADTDASGSVGANMHIGRRSAVGTSSRGLVRFDVSSIPAGSTITDADLTITVSQHCSLCGTAGPDPVTPPSTNFLVYSPASSSWVEGTTGANETEGGSPPAMPCVSGATWSTRNCVNAWTAGATGSFLGVSSSRTSVGGHTLNDDTDIRDAVQGWVGSAGSASYGTNGGFLIRASESTNYTARVVSAVSLSVTYTKRAGQSCSINGDCTSGNCAGGFCCGSASCNSPSNCRVTTGYTCDSAGACAYPTAASNGSVCATTDGNACTSDTCNAGSCGTASNGRCPNGSCVDNGGSSSETAYSCSCNGGYYQTGSGASTTCSTCTAIANCASGLTCSTGGNQTCATCASGYVGDGTNSCTACASGTWDNANTCVDCGSIANCGSVETCDQTTGNNDICPTCAAGYVGDGTGTCTACGVGTWDNSNVCTDCGTIANCSVTETCNVTNGSGLACATCAPGSIGDGTSTCTACASGTYDNGAVCTDCGTIANCSVTETCNVTNGASVICPTCTSGFRGNGTGTCTACASIANCASGLTCTTGVDQTCGTCASGFVGDGTGTCTACGTGTWDNNNVCTDCGTIANCASVETCSVTTGNGDICPTCATGHFGSGTGSCTACTAIPNCGSGLTCTTNSNQSCATCAPGYVGDGTASCAACPSGTWDNANTCVDCGTIANCAVTETCNQTTGNNDICPTCAAGYFGSGTGSCTACTPIANCAGGLTCTSNSNQTCGTCAPGYVGDGTGACTPCGVGTWDNANVCTDCGTIMNCASVETCDVTTGNNDICPTCAPGFNGSGTAACGNCTAIPNCASGLTCTNSSDQSCGMCNPGYSGDGTNTCTVCPNGTWDDGVGSCDDCGTIANCAVTETCTVTTGNNDICPTCAAGFVGDGTGACVACSAGTWDNSDVCTDCGTIANCGSVETCNVTTGNNDICPTCTAGYVGDGTGTCTVCGAGTWESSNVCIDCGTIANCAAVETCNVATGNNDICPTCAAGTFGSGTGACTTCTAIPNCASAVTCTTNSDQLCASCAPGYVGDGTGTCTACPSGTWENGNTCVDCGTIANCGSVETCNVTNGNSDVCPTCSPGYVGDGTGSCTACGVGTWDNNNVCTDCGTIANCNSVETCNVTTGNGDICPTCAAGYFGNGTGACTACTAIANCAGGVTCTTNSDQTCSACAPGYVGDGTGNCTLCAAGTWESSNTCVDCGTIANCGSVETCNVTTGNNDICPSCAAGFIGDGTGACTACGVGTWDNNNACVDCGTIANCGSVETCNVTNGGGLSCATCAPGTIGDGTGACTACGSGTYDNNNACIDCGTISNCASTETCNAANGSNLICPVCANGFNGNGTGVCGTCTAIANCAGGLTCTTPSDQVCGTCAAGTVGDGTPTCSPCGSGTYDNNNACVDCGTIANCAVTETCSTIDGAGLACPGCAPGFIGDGSGACTACGAGTYDNADACVDCGTIANCTATETCNAADGTSLVCPTCGPGFTGDGTGVCALCAVGTYESANACIDCGSIANCSVAETCDAADGSLLVCPTCDIGYRGDGTASCTACTPIADCASDLTCTTDSDQTCGTCATGYAPSVDGSSCQDVDECVLDTDNCDVNAACANSVGAFVCTCNAGYNGDGVTCVDDDECAGQGSGNNCDVNALCENTPGRFTCRCNTGYSGSGVTCIDVNECAQGTDNCEPTLATCTNTPGAFTCMCNPGYIGDGVTCSGVCGDGVVSPDEGCDDGDDPLEDGDGCSATCTVEPGWDCTIVDAMSPSVCEFLCGNGVIDTRANETCDNGAMNVAIDVSSEPGLCRAVSCQVTGCGDGTLDDTAGEVCDDGAANSDTTDGACRTDCSAARCGDGVVDVSLGETCDDGMGTTAADCSTLCAPADAGTDAAVVDAGVDAGTDATVPMGDASVAPDGGLPPTTRGSGACSCQVPGAGSSGSLLWSSLWLLPLLGSRLLRRRDTRRPR